MDKNQYGTTRLEGGGGGGGGGVDLIVVLPKAYAVGTVSNRGDTIIAKIPEGKTLELIEFIGGYGSSAIASADTNWGFGLQPKGFSFSQALSVFGSVAGYRIQSNRFGIGAVVTATYTLDSDTRDLTLHAWRRESGSPTSVWVLFKLYVS